MFVITNGKAYMAYSDTGAIKIVPIYQKAEKFTRRKEAISVVAECTKKLKRFYVMDVDLGQACWTRPPQQIEKINRKIYSYEVRRMIYMKSEGRCALCGKKIRYIDMTLDHIHPLAMGGIDAVENLQCACRSCNWIKGNLLPEEFTESLGKILIYQMNKTHGKKLMWKITSKLLNRMI